ncbi:hypothetical protein LCGC14_1957340 [marine sediment metagenome]|uniref:Uncharacterized protein n=1 Tax=marine sediment metagenome TaxID=412755 RepID=A0A0F9G3W9_9ZZZZ
MVQEREMADLRVTRLTSRIEALERLVKLGLIGADFESLQLEVQRQKGLLGRLAGDAGIGNVLYGIEAPQNVKVLSNDLTEINVDNTTTKTVIFTFDIEAGDLVPLGGIQLTLGGDLKSDASGTLTVEIKWGTDTLTSAATTIQSAAARWKWYMEFVIGASSPTAQKLALWFQAIVSSTDFGLRRADISGSHMGNARAAFTQNLLKRITLEVNVKWSVAGASLLFRKDMGILRLLPNPK